MTSEMSGRSETVVTASCLALGTEALGLAVGKREAGEVDLEACMGLARRLVVFDLSCGVVARHPDVPVVLRKASGREAEVAELLVRPEGAADLGFDHGNAVDGRLPAAVLPLPGFAGLSS